ncbi:MAG: serine hydrolase domain-containing protein [Nocardioidaceae bacterium]
MQGFPPPPDQRVTLVNWQTPPFNRWAFQHVREVVPTARVSRGHGPVIPLPDASRRLDEVPVHRVDGRVTPVSDVLADTFTDGFLLMHAGRLVSEQYPDGMRPDRTHLLMSVTKSFVSCVAGILVDRGTLDLQVPMTVYVPELSTSGYAGATLRHVLDMRSGIVFSEDYLDQNAEVRVLEEAIGWRPRGHAHLPAGMYDYLLALGADGEHGGPFSYRSCETDMLGWVCERATGVRMPELVSDLIWSRLGVEHDADFAIDSSGAAMHDAGLNTTLRDLGRFGRMLLEEGRAADGEQVVPPWWIRDAYTGDPDSRHAFAVSPTDTRMPGGMYRSQFWLPYPDRAVLLCLGIHGQMVYVNPAARIVGVKLSSWPTAQDATLIFDTLRMFDALAERLAGQEEAPGGSW